MFHSDTHSKTLILCRGLSGSGKSTLAYALVPHYLRFTTDDYFLDSEGNYCFDRTKLPEAHKWCQAQVQDAMRREGPTVVVHNTFSQAWEARHYLGLAKHYGYSVFIVECQNNFGNTHNVPTQTIERMRDRWEPLTGEPLPLRRILQQRARELKYQIQQKLGLR